MVRTSKTLDLTTLQMALVGYQFEKERIDAKIRELQAMLKGKTAPAAEQRKPRVKRVLSESARNRIAAGQKKRWAEFHKRTAAEPAAG